MWRSDTRKGNLHMISLRNLVTRRLFGLEVTWILALAGGSLLAVACGSDAEDCAQTQTCIDGSPEAGAGGEGNQGGTAGANGGSAGSGSGSGGSSGTESGGGTSAGGMSGMSGEGGEPTGGTSGNATGGASGAGSGGEGGSDTDPPSIVSVYPEDGATGIRSAENIVITFSEPMDHASTEAAFAPASGDLRPASFLWNASSTVLTVNPLTALVYAEGTDLAIAARQYSASLEGTAEDESGNRLADDFAWTFATLRRITQTIAVPWTSVLDVNSTDGVRNCSGPTDRVFAGDTPENAGIFILVSVDISGLPAGATVEGGTLSGEQVGTNGNPYADLGTFYAYGTRAYPIGTAAWGSSPIEGTLVFATTFADGVKTANVTQVISSHYAERTQRNNLSQYRLQFDPLQSDTDSSPDLAHFMCDSFALGVVYTVP
jgi:hypothetical protein